jgi:hypothetical protein
MLKVDAIFQRIACACTTITLATKRQNNQKQSDLDPSNLGKIKRVYCRKRWILETPVSCLKILHSIFVDMSFSPVLTEFFHHLLLLSPLFKPGKQAESFIMCKDVRHCLFLPFFQQYAILQPYRLHSQSHEQHRRMRDVRLIYPGRGLLFLCP